MRFVINAFFNLSIGSGAIASLIKIKKADQAFLPFILLLWLELMDEITGISLMKPEILPDDQFNLFLLTEALLITWQYRRWGLFGQHTIYYYFLQSGFIGGWVAEHLLSIDSTAFNSYFITVHSVIIALMNINMLSKTMFKDPFYLFSNPVFLICAGLAIHFIYAILEESFGFYGLHASKHFRMIIFQIPYYICLFTNLVFALATIWIPTKRQYIIQSLLRE